MRALVYDGHAVRLTADHPAPRVQPGQALLQVRLAGVCNTDLELVRGYMGFRGVLGHEFVADVVDGPDAWRGLRVVGEINVAAGDCDMCRAGVPSQCRKRTTVGIDRHDGAFADLLALDVRNLHAVPRGVPDVHAVFAEPLAAALQVTEAVHITPRDRVLVVGVGKLGALVAQVLALSGAHITGVVRREAQAALLAAWRIPAATTDTLPPAQADVVVDCTGTAEGFAVALGLVRPRGTIVLKSTYTGLPQADLTRVVVDEVRVVGSRCGPFKAALRMLALGLIDVDALVEATYALGDGLAALDHAARPGAGKVLLRISGSCGGAPSGLGHGQREAER